LKSEIENMKYIKPEIFSARDEWRKSYQSKTPFRYLVIDNILNEDGAKEVYEQYPAIKDGEWDGTTYLDQKNKFQKRVFEKNSCMQNVFDELNSDEFLQWLNYITDIKEPLISDPSLFGGGLHQSINGAFLNVHVDYNIHPVTKFHRRLNVLIYMNPGWKDEYEGDLELWEINDYQKRLLEKISPKFNRLVVFETNEISFHGHPKPLNTPADVSRKSIATYYYTKTRPSSEIADDHNTRYINTEGAKGSVRRFKSGVKALLERVNPK
jgi:Rps23 Pro-64 3,4-dihydroxylase Tpa1-like proline 4-hydroxylase